MRKFGEIWSPTDSGIFVPSGHVTEVSDRRRITFAHAKSNALEIEKLYTTNNLELSPESGLAKLIENAKKLSDGWLMNQWDGLGRINAMYSLHLQRIAEAILPLAKIPNRRKYLEELMSGEVDFFKRQASRAKDILWELELWALLSEAGSHPVLQDPPDIVLPIEDRTLGIACKKVYSEKNVEKILSEAVSQVEGSYDIGVVAVNLDELVPEECVLKVDTERQMAHMLQGECSDFVHRHERHFRKYLSTGRLVAALFSVHVVAEVAEWNGTFNNCRQSLVWNIPGLVPEKERLLRRFEQIVVSAPSAVVGGRRQAI